MADQFVGEIRIVGFNFPPVGWAFCNGQLLPISQNTALFSLLGTFYGGDGKSTFALPNLQGNVAIGQGQGPGLSDRFIGETGGSQNVTLLTTEIGSHNHGFNASTATGTVTAASGNQLGHGVAGNKQNSYTANIYSPNAGSATTALSSNALTTTGGGQAHNNLMPYLTLNFVIALQGIFPSRA